MSTPTLDRAEDAARAALTMLGRDATVSATHLPQGVQLEVTDVPGVRVPIRLVLTWQELVQPHWRHTVRRRLRARQAL